MKEFTNAIWKDSFIGVNEWIKENSDKDFLVFVRNDIFEVPSQEVIQKYSNAIFDSGIVMMFHSIGDKVNKGKEDKITITNSSFYDTVCILFLPIFYPGIVIILNKVFQKLDLKIQEKATFIDGMNEIYGKLVEHEMVPPHGWYPMLESTIKDIKIKEYAKVDPSAVFASPVQCKMIDLEIQMLLQRIEKNYSNKRKLFE